MDESLRRDQEQDDAMAASEGKQPDSEQSEETRAPKGAPETGGAGVSPGGLTGGYGTGGVTPEEQAAEGKA
jgi:hypothetical protein